MNLQLGQGEGILELHLVEESNHRQVVGKVWLGWRLAVKMKIDEQDKGGTSGYLYTLSTVFWVRNNSHIDHVQCRVIDRESVQSRFPYKQTKTP